MRCLSFICTAPFHQVNWLVCVSLILATRQLARDCVVYSKLDLQVPHRLVGWKGVAGLSLIYFLTASGARALEQTRGISWETIPTGPPHTYHKEHFLRLVDVRLAMEDAELAGVISGLEFTTGREFWKELASDLTEAERASRCHYFVCLCRNGASASFA